MVFSYTLRSVPCPAAIREASSGSRWERMQRNAARHSAERKSHLEISIVSLPSMIWESQGGEQGQTVGVRGDGEHGPLAKDQPRLAEGFRETGCLGVVKTNDLKSNSGSKLVACVLPEIAFQQAF